MTQEEERIARKLLDLTTRGNRVQERNGVVYFDGFALGVGAVELNRNVVRDRRRRQIPDSDVIGPIAGFDLWKDFYAENPSIMFRTQFRVPRLTDYNFFHSEGFIDIDDQGKVHAFACDYYWEAGSNPLVAHGDRSFLLPDTYKVTLGGYLSSVRACNGWAWMWPDNALVDDPPPLGWTVDLWKVGVNGEGLASYEITGSESLLSNKIGTQNFSGNVPMYPGGPTYPLSFDFEGIDHDTKTYDYATIPTPTNIGPDPNPDPEDAYADYNIYQVEFTILEDIATPLILIIDGFEEEIWQYTYLGIVSWLTRAVRNVGNTIVYEYRKAPDDPNTDFTPDLVQLFGNIGRTYQQEFVANVSYTLPIMVDISSDSMIAESYSGTVSENRYYPGSGSSENLRRIHCSDSGTERTFLRREDGEGNVTETPIDGYMQYQFYLLPDDIGKPTDQVRVGDTIRLSRSTSLTHAFVNPTIDGHDEYDQQSLAIFVPGTEWGEEQWEEDGSTLRLFTHNSPRTDHAAALMEKMAPGAKVYGILYDTGVDESEDPRGRIVSRSTVYKGVITSSSLVKLYPGDVSFLHSGGFYNRAMYSGLRPSLKTPAGYLLSHLEFQITELVATNIAYKTWSFFGDYWWSKRPFNYPRDKSGTVTLDGSIRNVFPTEAYWSGEFAHRAGYKCRYIFSEGTFMSGYVGAKFNWSDPYIWRFARDYYVDHYEGWVQGTRSSSPVQVPRWKLDYSGPVVKCWFDGVDEFELMPPDRSEYWNATYIAALALDRKMALKRLQ